LKKTNFPTYRDIKMKIKLIAAACVALCSVSAFAAALNPKTDTPQLTFYIGGASAQKAAVLTVVPANLFATPAEVIRINETNNQKTTGFYGMSNPDQTGGTSVRLFVAYNSTNGSAQGVNQLLSNGTPEAESKIVLVGNASCSVPVASTPTQASPYGFTSTCSTTSTTGVEVDMALSDVYPGELVPGALVTGPQGGVTLADLSIFPTAFQGFGIVVNSALYSALQTAQGLVAGSDLAANQPSITRSQYASLIAKNTSVASAASLLGNTDTNGLTLVRRTDTSGTQAASNLFFANNFCGLAVNPFDESGKDLGALGIKTSTVANAYVDGKKTFSLTQETGAGAVLNRLNPYNVSTNPTGIQNGYGIGVVSLENPALTTAGTWRYVKIDGVSPNFKADGTADLLNRNAFASGRYPFAFEMSAMYKTSAPDTTVALASAVIKGLADSGQHDLIGIAYLDSLLPYSVGGKQSYVSRGGNNCQPAVH
jgi:hypothetical protein